MNKDHEIYDLYLPKEQEPSKREIVFTTLLFLAIAAAGFGGALYIAL